MDHFEDSPLLASTETEAIKIQRKKTQKRNIIVSLLAISLTLTVLTLVAIFGTQGDGASVSEGGEQVEKAILKATNGNNETGSQEEVKLSPVVKVAQGRLQGIVERSRKGREYFAFYSVPYGKAPVGSLRFELPEPAEKWSRWRVRDASQILTQCIQINKQFQVVGSEDCLHVHIYTPKLPEGRGRRRTDPQLPVLVYLYGGGFLTGTVHRFKATYMMDEEVILVIVDHRLGALGHLNTGDKVARGNLSFRDQNLALKWVNENIAQFGGSVDHIFLVGSSSGSMSVHAHMLSEMNQGLFSAAMCESGVASSPNAEKGFSQDPKITAQNLGLAVGCQEVNDSQILVDCLRNVEATRIVELTMTRPDLVWGPTLDKVFDDEGDLSTVFWRDTPLKLMQKGQVIKVPFHLAVNSAEEYGAAYDLLRTPETIKAMNENWTTVVMQDRLGFSADLVTEELSTKIKKFYFGDDASHIDRKHRDNLTDLLSDRAWIHPTRLVAQFHAKHSPVYLHYFSKEPKVSLYDNKKDSFDPPHRAGHGDQVQFLFPYVPFPEIPLEDENAQFSMDFVKIVVSIAAGNGVPTVDGSREAWGPMTEEQNGTVWFHINDKPLRHYIQPFTERVHFWDSIPLETLYPGLK